MVGRRSDGRARRLLRAGSLLAVVAGASWMAPGVPAPAQAATPPPAGAASAQEEYEQLTADEVRLFTEYQATVQRATDLTAQVDRISATLAEVGIELNAAEQVLATADAAVEAATTRLDDTEHALVTARQRLRDRAVEAYIGGGIGAGGLAQADAVVRADSLNDVNRAMAYSDAVVTDQKTLVDRVAVLRDETQRLRETAQAAQQDAAVRRDGVAERRAQIQASRDELATVQEQVVQQAQAQQSMLTDVSAKRQEYAQRVAAAQASSDSLAGVLRQRQEGQSLPPLGGGVLKMPVPGARISSTFGPRIDPVLGGTGRHDGIDFSAPTGTPIHAAADGVVVNAGEMGGYGNGTVIDHGNGLATLYGHQSQILVTPGQTVRTGDVIGLVGSTGKSTGPHLHFEVRAFGVPTDPVPYLST
jgi:murein DD-endopeptidase MepM/ murein hydrolase activator NlpD